MTAEPRSFPHPRRVIQRERPQAPGTTNPSMVSCARKPADTLPASREHQCAGSEYVHIPVLLKTLGRHFQTCGRREVVRIHPRDVTCGRGVDSTIETARQAK